MFTASINWRAHCVRNLDEAVNLYREYCPRHKPSARNSGDITANELRTATSRGPSIGAINRNWNAIEKVRNSAHDSRLIFRARQGWSKPASTLRPNPPKVPVPHPVVPVPHPDSSDPSQQTGKRTGKYLESLSRPPIRRRSVVDGSCCPVQDRCAITAQ